WPVTGACRNAARRVRSSKTKPVASAAACAPFAAPLVPSRWNGSNSCRPDMNPSAPDKETSRRGFFQLTLGWLAAIFALTASAAGAVRFLVPNVLFEPDQRFKAGKPNDYLDGSVTFLDDERLFIV